MQETNVNELIDYGIENGFIKKVGKDHFGMTDKGNDDFFEKSMKLYEAVVALEMVPSSVPTQLGYKVILEAWLKSFEGNTVAAYLKLVEVENLGYKQWIQFEMMEKNTKNLLPN